MKKQALFVSAALVVASSFAAIVGGCGSDGAVVQGPGSGTDSGELPPGTDPDSSSTSSSSNPDGSTNNPQPDGSTNNPGAGAGKIACGSTECTTSTDVCCTKGGLGDGGFTSTSTCQPKDDSCTGGIKSGCDEAADCAGGEVCCLGINLVSSCTAEKCGTLTLQLCKEAGECKNDGGTCTEYTCQGDRKVMACSKPPGCK